MPINVQYLTPEEKEAIPASGREYNPNATFQNAHFLVSGTEAELEGFYYEFRNVMQGNITLEGLGKENGRESYILSVPMVEGRKISERETLYTPNTQALLAVLKGYEEKGFAFDEAPNEKARYIADASTKGAAIDTRSAMGELKR